MMVQHQVLMRKIIPLLFALFYFFLLSYQAERVAITDDARFYMDAGKKYAKYYDYGWKGFKYFNKKHIDRYWETNHEHPPFAKLLMAGGYLILHKKLDLLPETVSLRIGISLFAAVFLLFLFSFVHRAFSFNAAVFTSLFFIFLPRTFFHARVSTLDFPVAATSFIFVYCYYRGLSSKFWAWMTGVAFGVALSTKLNAPFMVFPVLIHYVTIKRKQLITAPLKTIFAPQFVSMLLLSLPIFFLMWPYLWYDTVNRFMWYAKFHMDHYGILMYYLGNIYSEPRPPWHAPFVKMLVTTPLITVLCAFVSPMFYRWKEELDNYRPFLLVVLSGVISIAVLMFMPAPFYSGVKLFQPFFPFFAIMAGVGLVKLIEKVTLVKKSIATAVSFFFFLPVILQFIDLKHDHLSYYSEAVGGTKGALEYRFERQYYDLFYYDLAQYFNKELTSFSRVSFEPNGGEYRHTSQILKKSELLTKKFSYSSGKTKYHVLTHEYRWRKYPSLLRSMKREKPVFILKRQGVPLLNIYKESFKK